MASIKCVPNSDNDNDDEDDDDDDDNDNSGTSLSIDSLCGGQGFLRVKRP